MTGPSALAFPGSRTLAGWWRQLAPHRPLALWFAHLVLHRVEAPVLVNRPYRPDPLARHLLKTLAFFARGAEQGASAAQIDQHLRLGPQILGRMCEEMRRAGLLQESGGTWALTEAGRLAQGEGEIQTTRQERHSFYFLAGSPPVYLPLLRVETVPWVAGPDWS